jgi:transposase
MKKHIVHLPDEVCQALHKMVSSGTRPAQVVRRCQVLLKSAEGCTDQEIAEHVGCTDRTVRTLRRQFCVGGVEQAIFDSPRSGRPESFTERQRQQVVH